MENDDDNEKSIVDDIEEMLGKEAADRVKQLQHGESILSGGKPEYQSVLKILLKAVQDVEKDYRQALVLAAFLDRDDATIVVAALDERRRYGVDITPVVDLISAWTAVEGARGGRAGLAIEGQTHQSITTNLPGVLKDKFKKKKDEPLS